MPESSQRIAVDSGVLIAYLNHEEGRYEKSRDLLEAAQEGSVKLWAPAVLLVEVLHWSHDAKAQKPDAQDLLDDFLDSEWLHIVEVDKRMARIARRIVGETRITKGVDALYVATAAIVGASQVLSWDDRLANVKYDDVAGGNPPGATEPRLELPE